MATYISPKDIKADKTYQVNGVTWNEYLLKNHNVNNISLPPKRKEDFLGITVHCTNDLENVEDDGRQYTAATLNGAMGGVCTTLYIDDLYAWQNLDLDSMNYTCGDKMGWGNSRTISLEVIMDGTTGENNLKAKDNAARIAAFLLHKYGKTANDLYTHNYWLNKGNIKGDPGTNGTNATTTAVVSTTANGLCPKRDGSTTNFLRGDGTWATPPDTNTTYGAATASASGLVSTTAQTFAGAKTFNGSIYANGATAAGTQQCRNLAVGTAAATASNCPSGSWYGQYD